MICPAIRTVLMGAFTLLTLAGGLRAHIPDKLVIDLELGEDWWEASSEMEVKFAVVALLHHYLPPDTGSGWIENLNTGQLGLVRDLTEKLYRERFQFAIGGERVEMEVGFPDYGNPPLKFGLGENEEPVVRVVMRGPLPRERGAMTVGVERALGAAPGPDDAGSWRNNRPGVPGGVGRDRGAQCGRGIGQGRTEGSAG
ncbi:MAG: hypothetical protein ACKJSK_21530, partial [Roseibacillus sp.]